MHPVRLLPDETPGLDAPRQLTAQAAGNPLYLHELVDTMTRERAPQARPADGVSAARHQLSASLAAVLTDRLNSVSAGPVIGLSLCTATDLDGPLC